VSSPASGGSSDAGRPPIGQEAAIPTVDGRVEAASDADDDVSRRGPNAGFGAAADLLDQRLRAAEEVEPSPTRVQSRRLGDAMRSVIDRLVATSAPAEDLARAADQLEAIVSALERHPQDRVYDGYAESANAGRPHAFFDWSPFLGRSNPLAPPISVEMLDGLVVGRAKFGSAYEGPPGCVHGGFIAAAFDEVLGMTQSLSGMPGMTGRLEVRYRKPTPLHSELRFVGRLLGVAGRKISTHGELWAGGLLTAEADGLFISVELGKFTALIEERQRRLEGG
jgi:acyl-coenzyme A thioesterase PaaI-like protein